MKETRICGKVNKCPTLEIDYLLKPYKNWFGGDLYPSRETKMMLEIL
mgnify:CR=1 FL=1